MSGDDPPYLPVGTDVSAKYKGAFCEAKVSKVVRVLQLKVTYVGPGLGTGTVTDEQIKIIPSGNNQSQSGLLPLRVGQTVQVKHPEKKDYVNATINRIRDCSQYTVVFDDGDITTLRRTALCLKSGRHFNESETLDQLPLTHPEHFGNPVVGGRRGRRSRQLKEDSSDEGEDLDDMELDRSSGSNANAANMGKDVGKVVCVETSEGKRKASRDSNWFPGLVVAPTAQAAVRINTREECLIRSFKDGRYYTVPRKEMTEFKRDGATTRVDSPPLAEAVDKALNYLDKAELPQHWDKDVLFGLHLGDFDSDENYTDSSDDEPREEKDHFVAQLYKFMDDRGTPLNKGPIICNRDVDLYRFFRIVEKLGGYNSVTNKNRWRAVTARLGFTKNSATTLNLVKQAYFRFLFPFEEFNRKLGCTMVAHPRNVKKNRGRSLIRDKDRATPVQINSPKPEPKTEDSNDTVISEKEKKEEVIVEKEETTKKKVKPPPLKEESIVKIKKEDVTDSSGSEGILDVISDNVQTPTVKKANQENFPSTSQKNVKKQTDSNKSSTSTAAKRSKVPGEKVKALVEKFEEQSKLEDDEKVQQTRSKSSAAAAVSRKDSVISPERKGRDVKNSQTQENTTTSKPSSNTSSGSKPQRSNRPSADEEKKRGRKKKEPEEKTQFSDGSMSDPPSVIVKNVNIGDKLIVYYGPNLESKVTYEAKVLEIERDDAGPIYLVHYTGWNNRYDEWIKPHRIAENISQTSKGKRPSKTSFVKNSTTSNPNAGKRGRGASVSSRNTSSENQGQPPNQARSTTPSSVTSTSSRTKSPATPAARAPSARLAKQAESVTKRSTSVNNNGNQSSSTRQSSTASDSDSGNSDSEDSPKRRPLKRKEETPERMIDEESPTERPKRARKTPKKNLAETVTIVATPPNKITPSVTSSPSTPIEVSEPKGRDYDLNQIRSELKGFEKALKLNSPTSTNPPSTIEEIIPKVTVESPPKSVLSIKPPVEEIIKKKEKSPEKEVKEKEVKEIKPVATDDIYEFKEPEPLELESRAKLNDDKTAKKRRLLEDLDKPIEKLTSPKKKLPVRTPPKNDNKLNDTGDKKSRFRRNLSKKSEDSESSSPESKSPAYTEKPVEPPTESVNTKTRILYASDEAFDKLVISPCFNLKTTTPSKSPVPPDTKIKIEEIDTKLIKSEVIIEELKITPEENLIATVENDIKDSSSLENSDEDDPIHVAIRGIAESKDDDDSSDQLLITQTFTPITKVLVEAKKEICLSTKDIVETKAVIIPIVSDVKEIKENINVPSKPCDDIPEKSNISEQEIEIEVKIPPLESEKIITNQLKKEEKVKQISPALQETDSLLLEAAIQPPTTELSNTENIIIPKRTGPRIASSILQKFNAIKKKEENPSPVKSDTTVVSSDEIEDVTKSPIKLFNDESEVQIKTEIKEEDTTPTSPEVVTNQQDFKRRSIVGKKNLSREFIDSDDTDSDSDSEERLVIARSDDESQTSQPESTTSNAPDNKIIDSVKDTDSNTSALRINTEESSQDSKSKVYSFESTILENKEEKVDVISSVSKTEEEPDSNISLLLCEETIPGSPAPVTESIQGNIPEVRTKPKSAKSLVLEIPFASAPGTSKTLLSEQLKHGVVKIDTKSPSTTPITAVVPITTVSNIPSSTNTILPANISSTNNAGGNISTTLVTSSIKPLVAADIAKEDIDDTHHHHVSTVNSPPTTPESSISNLSPRGENGGSSSGTADESVKSQRGSEASEIEQFRAVRITKPQHYSEEDTLLNSEATAVERIKKASPQSINEDSESAIPTTTVTSSSTPVAATNRKRRKSYKGEDAPANPPIGAKRGRKPNALKNIRNITSSNVPSSTNSDSDDTSEHSSATSANTIPVGPSSGSNTGPEIRLQTNQHNNPTQRVSKYNFLVDLDPEMDSSSRIALLQQRIADLRKAYSNEKNNLACIERRLKKIRRREREALKAAKQEISCS